MILVSFALCPHPRVLLSWPLYTLCVRISLPTPVSPLWDTSFCVKTSIFSVLCVPVRAALRSLPDAPEHPIGMWFGSAEWSQFEDGTQFLCQKRPVSHFMFAELFALVCSILASYTKPWRMITLPEVPRDTILELRVGRREKYYTHKIKDHRQGDGTGVAELQGPIKMGGVEHVDT